MDIAPADPARANASVAQAGNRQLLAKITSMARIKGDGPGLRDQLTQAIAGITALGPATRVAPV